MNKIGFFLFLFLLVGTLLLTLVFTDKVFTGNAVCIGQSCSVSVSIYVLEGPLSTFFGSVKTLSEEFINNANVSILGTSLSILTTNGTYNLTGELNGAYDLIASKEENFAPTAD